MIIFAEISSPLLTYYIDDLFCQENWNNAGQNRLFLFVKLLCRVAELKGRLVAIANARPIKFQVPYLDKCQTCKKPLTAKEKELGGAKKVEFSDSWYLFCSYGCSRIHDYQEAVERGERKEEYLKKYLEQEILIQQVVKELDERDGNGGDNDQETNH